MGGFAAGVRDLPFSPKQFVDQRLPAALGRVAGPIAERLEPLFAEGDQASTRRMAASAFVVRIASAALAYVSQIVLARWMGGFEYGIFVVVWTAVITSGVILCFGLEQAVVRLVRAYEVEGDFGAIRGLLLASRLATFFGASAIAVVGAAALWRHPDLVSDYYRLPFFLAAVCVPIYTICEIQDGIARSQAWPDLALMPTFIWRPLLILAGMGVAFLCGLEMTAVNACWAAIAATWVTVSGQMFVIERRLAGVVPAAPRRYHLAAWAKLAAPIFLIDSFFALLNSVDIFVVGRFAEPQGVAVYFATVKTLALVHFVYYAAKTSAGQRFATLFHSKDHAGLATFAAEVVRWTFWASVGMSIVLLIAGKPLLFLFGREFTSGYGILFILVIGVLARASVGPAESLLTMAGQQTACATVYGATLAVSLVLNLVLTPIYGIWGAAVATTSAMIFESIVLYVVVRRRLGIGVFVLAPAHATIPFGKAWTTE